MATWKKVLLAAAAAGLGLLLLCAGIAGPCWSAWVRWGAWVETCPAGVLPVVGAEVSGLARGAPGSISVDVHGQAWSEDLASATDVPLSRIAVDLLLVAPGGKERALHPERGWSRPWTGRFEGQLALPDDLADDDYTLAVVADTPAGTARAEIPLPVFQRARVHLLTDAPLYRPGQAIRFRAVVLGARDLAPLADRAGRFVVSDPSGEVLLEEKARTDDMGVADTSFPLAADATEGAWSIAFRTGGDQDEVTARVEAFQLPKVVVTAEPGAPWFEPGQRVSIRGRATYGSGAPVQGGTVQARLRRQDGWPPPTEWISPGGGTTGADGSFAVELGELPGDVQRRGTLSYTVAIADEAGERAEATVALVVAPTGVQAELVTELGDALVADANNRAYVRVTRPDGTALPGAPVRLYRGWDKADPGVGAVADADAVAVFQVDPGLPITVVEPLDPVRIQAQPAVGGLRVTSASDGFGGGTSTGDDAALDRWAKVLRRCDGKVPVDGADVQVLLAMDRAGAVRWAAISGSVSPPLQTCLIAAAREIRGAPGEGARVVRLGLRGEHDRRPYFVPSTEALAGDVPTATLESGLVEARACLPSDATRVGTLRFAWRVQEGAKPVEVEPLDTEGGAIAGGVAGHLGRARDPEPSEASAAGTLQLTVAIPSAPAEVRPDPATYAGFEYRVEVQGVGTTLLRVRAGEVPPLRLRVDPPIAKPGQAVTVAAVRGPGWSGVFPEKLQLRQAGDTLLEFDFDPKARAGTFTVPAGARGFASIDLADAKALLFIPPAATLDVTLDAVPPTWKPNTQSKLVVRTQLASGPGPASVTLAGLDATMSALAALPSPSDMARVTTLATTPLPAFGVLDAHALVSGLLRGENARLATMTRLALLDDSELRPLPCSARAESVPDLLGPLSDAFYTARAEARAAVRAWEKSAPAAELFTHGMMVDTWDAAVAKVGARDPFGRPLRLPWLPAELRALLDPRLVVGDGARLPEDYEDWEAFVAREVR